MYLLRWGLSCVLACSLSFSFSQPSKTAKYPSLFWEITGNGLKKPSYLFGTMHVSNKMVFHLSDSFYYALKRVDAVSLELNPEIWQGEMVQWEKMKANYSDFSRYGGYNFLHETSFKIDKFEDKLKAAISSEPATVNGLLYRSYGYRDDFEEDTFLDLYIYQTGKKLGKRATGVENYYESEKLMLEAYTDMAKEKKKKSIDWGSASMYDVQGKMEEAYKKQDLDMLDSLEKRAEPSEAFLEKFLYKRNEIQAYSIDTILKKNSLFVGVGAAHLPGERGVIELLRKMGYTLRPIKMNNREVAQKEKIDQLKVPVQFIVQRSEDGFLEVSAPGKLYQLGNEYMRTGFDQMQYSDMANGVYYLITRVKTHAAFQGLSESDVYNKVDSLLYENIPGKIISKKAIEDNGYKGLEVTNKTKRGMFQRYQIFVTPFEVIIFKMSGNEGYMKSNEAAQFFSSIKLKRNQTDTHADYSPRHGGFSVHFPTEPIATVNKFTPDGKRWEYSAVDHTNGDVYLILKKNVQNYTVLEADTFDLSMMEESFRSADFFDKQLNRQFVNFKGYASLNVSERLKDGATIFAKHIIKGNDYYTIAVRTRSDKKAADSFWNSFKLLPYQYGVAKKYVDTFMNYSVMSPVLPNISEDLRKVVSENSFTERMFEESYWRDTQNGNFTNEATGETINVQVLTYPKYFFIKDSVKYWDEGIKNCTDDDLIVYKKEFFKLNDSVQGMKLLLRDTGSSKQVNRLLLLKDNVLYSLTSKSDSLQERNDFFDSFFQTFIPLKSNTAFTLDQPKIDLFFKDFLSKDSITHAKAARAIFYVDFDEGHIPGLINAINQLSVSDKNYFELKCNLISALATIKDSTKPVVVNQLKKLYEQSGDTVKFQQQILIALLSHRTAASYTLFKELILQDPPVFEEDIESSSMLDDLNDSLKLSKSLFPDLLQLTVLEDYKPKVLSLLATLLDSGYVSPKEYESYLPKIIFDAKIKLKKQQVKDEKQVEKDLKKDEENNYADYVNSYRDTGAGNSDLYNYGTLLMPFYEKNESAKKIINRLGMSRDPEVQLDFAVLMIKNNKPVGDSIVEKLASDNKYRAKLFAKLQKINHIEKFPLQYRNQLEIAKSSLFDVKSYMKIDTIEFIDKQWVQYDGKRGFVYCFKYKSAEIGDWKMATSGLFDVNEKLLQNSNLFTILSEKEIKADVPLAQQFQKLIKAVIFSTHKGGKFFFEGSDLPGNYHMDE